MKFENLASRMEYLRSLSDYKLTPGIPVLAMVDGHCFSRMIKKRYKLPFDDIFIELMNKTAEYVASKIQGCKVAYVQSDEITFFISDYDTPDTDSFFGYRLCKLQSIISSYTTGFFNREILKGLIECPCSDQDRLEMLNDLGEEPFTFDCKVFNMPTENDAFAYFLWRQNDCKKNSVSQAAQSSFSHNSLLGKTTEDKLEMLRKCGKPWEDYDDGKKYGRLIYKESEHFKKVLDSGKEIEYDRSLFKSHNTTPFSREDNPLKFIIYDRETDKNS